MRKTKLMAGLLSAVMTVGCFAGCGSTGADSSQSSKTAETTEVAEAKNQEDSSAAVKATATEAEADTPAEDKQMKIVTTIFPEYDWVKTILGDKASNTELTLLLDNGVDLHSYQPTAEDMVKISECDMFVYVGGESDEWVEDILDTVENEDMVVINLMDVLGDSVKDEEVVEGMEHEHEHEHAEIEESDIKDRTLGEFAGEWKSLYPMLNAGDLEEYVEHHAEEHGEEPREVKEELLAKWKCEADKISVDGDKITFTYADGKTETASYKYAGFKAVKDEDGDITGVRYQFETDSADAPKYVQFNDHGFEPSEEVAHFHIYYGNESFDALDDFGANPYFVHDGLNADEVLEMLMGGHDHEEENDEHVWLSLKNADVICANIAVELGNIDTANKDLYMSNYSAYKEQLTSLDAEYKAAVDAGKNKTLLFGDRFPFRYLVDDYGLDYFAAFTGCSAESEASFETIVFLSGKVDELGLSAIMTIEGANHKIAETVRDNTTSKDQKILTMNSMQSTTSGDIANGTTYLSVMTSNLDVLKEALQ